MNIRALSVRQPWAWAITTGHKTVENRTWATNYRGLIAIHAACKVDPRGYEFLRRIGLRPPAEPVTGAIVGAARIVDCRRDAQSPWAMPNSWHWILGESVQLSEPLPCRGQTRLFRLPSNVTCAVERVIGTSDLT